MTTAFPTVLVGSFLKFDRVHMVILLRSRICHGLKMCMAFGGKPLFELRSSQSSCEQYLVNAKLSTVLVRSF